MALQKYGLDAVMHLRFLRNRCRIFCILFFFTSIVLFPIYAQGPNRRLPDDDPKQVVGILVVSLSNLADDDFRLWFTLVADLLILGMLLVFMYRDMSTFVAKRRVYRAQCMPANYTLLVRDMPMEMASSPTAVRAYWERFFPDTVAAVIIVRDDALYTSIKRRYVAAITRREVAEWRWVHKADRAPDARPQYKYRGSVATRVDAIAYWRAEAARLAALLVELQGSVGAASLAPPTRAAFVVFHERRSAALAAQAYLGHVASQHVVSHAPEPAAVNWPKLARVAWRSPIRKILSLVFVTFLCGVWALIVAAIRSLSDLQAIAQQLAKNSAFEWLEDLVNANEKLTTLLQGTLPPLLLFIVLKLIPGTSVWRGWGGAGLPGLAPALLSVPGRCGAFVDPAVAGAAVQRVWGTDVCLPLFWCDDHRAHARCLRVTPRLLGRSIYPSVRRSRAHPRAAPG